MKPEIIAAIAILSLLAIGLIYGCWSCTNNQSRTKRSAELFDTAGEDCALYEVNQQRLRTGTAEAMNRYHLAAAALLHKHQLELKDEEDLSREQLEQLPNYDQIREVYFPGDTQLGITAFNEMLRRSFEYSTGRLQDDNIRSQLQELDNQCDNIPMVCRTEDDLAACQSINDIMDGTMASIREMVMARQPPGSDPNARAPPGSEMPNVPRAQPGDLNGVPPIKETDPDLGADGAEESLAANRANADDPRSDPTFGTGQGPQSPSMVEEGRADEADFTLNRDAQRLYQFVLEKLSALYRDGDAGGNFQAGLSPDLFAAIDGLSEGQRAALCSAYCGQFTPCSELCRYMGCINCTVGNTPRDRQNPGNTGGGIGDPQIDMRGMVLPGSARVTDDYMLLDSKVIRYQAVPRGDVDVSRQGVLKGLIGMGDDMKGVVNVFAPTVHVHPAAK